MERDSMNKCEVYMYHYTRLFRASIPSFTLSLPIYWYLVVSQYPTKRKLFSIPCVLSALKFIMNTKMETCGIYIYIYYREYFVLMEAQKYFHFIPNMI